MINVLKLSRVALLGTLVIVFSACGEDRSHPTDPNAPNGEQPVIEYKNPVADINITATEHDFLREANDTIEFDFRSSKYESPFIVDGTQSYDADNEGNTTIVQYDWSFEEFFAEANCTDINNTGNGIVYIKLCETANQGDGNMTIVLEVKDNEGAKNTITKIFKVQ